MTEENTDLFKELSTQALYRHIDEKWEDLHTVLYGARNFSEIHRAAEDPLQKTDRSIFYTPRARFLQHNPLTPKKFSARVLKSMDLAPVHPRISGSDARVILAANGVEVKKMPSKRRRLDTQRFPRPKASVQPGAAATLRNWVSPSRDRFPAKFGWDSLWMVEGLVSAPQHRERNLEYARDLIENTKFEIKKYGHMVNATRVWGVDRTQPPVYSRMVMEMYHALRESNQHKAAVFLYTHLPTMKKEFRYWTRGERFVPSVGLSRYVGESDQPCPEVLEGEIVDGKGHYDHIKEWFQEHPDPRFYNPKTGELTPELYQNDRAMRATGADPSHRFGPYGAHTQQFCPVDLNTRIAQMARDIAEASHCLSEFQRARKYLQRSEEIIERINTVMWDDAEGVYRDYNWETGKHSEREHAMNLLPLTFGVAPDDRAQRLIERVRSEYLNAGGVCISPHDDQQRVQWEGDINWMHIAKDVNEGCRRYGDLKLSDGTIAQDVADDITHRSVTMARDVYAAEGDVFEKYNGTQRSAQVTVDAGYDDNGRGFGWTNGALERMRTTYQEPLPRHTFSAPLIQRRHSWDKAWSAARNTVQRWRVSPSTPQPKSMAK